MKKIGCVCLPTYNEAENVKIVIPRTFEQAIKIPTHDLHVVVIDDNSPDGTAAVVRGFMAEFPNLHLLTGEKKGLGEAYKRGIAYALKDLHADLIFEMDADLQHDPSLLPDFAKLANDGFSLIIGSRFISGGSTPRFPWQRKMISLLGTRLVRLFGGLEDLTDCTSGFRCIRADLFTTFALADLASHGYSFQSALLCELIRNGARVIEVPIVFHERKQGESKLSFRDQVEFISNLFRLRFNGRPAPPRSAEQAPGRSRSK
jgi:dolichol-phosphate mannosyltransferase